MPVVGGFPGRCWRAGHLLRSFADGIALASGAGPFLLGEFEARRPIRIGVDFADPSEFIRFYAVLRVANALCLGDAELFSSIADASSSVELGLGGGDRAHEDSEAEQKGGAFHWLFASQL